MTSRREFMAVATLAAAAVPALAKPGKKPMLIVNALGDLGNPNIALTRPQGDNPVSRDMPDLDARTFRDVRSSGLNALNITLGYVGGPEEPFEYTIRTIAMWDDVLKANPAQLMKVDTAADILRARDSGKLGIFYGFQ